jgi:hypothetical protein
MFSSSCRLRSTLNLAKRYSRSAVFSGRAGSVRLRPTQLLTSLRCINVDSNRKIDIMKAAMLRDDFEDNSTNAIRPKLRVSDILNTMEPKQLTI